MTREISNSEDILDSRDIIARIEELESERAVLAGSVEDAQQGNEPPETLAGHTASAATWDEDNAEELKALKALAEQAEGYALALIRDSYFKEYAEQLADDIGAIDRNARWPVNCIDWDQAARELQMDYTAVDFAGVTYWVR